MNKLAFISFKKYFLIICLLWLQTVQAESTTNENEAEAIFNKSVKIFTKKNIRFTVDSTITYADGYKERRTFFIATKNQGGEISSTLIRFLKPEEIKCTAVLINKHKDTYTRYAYFPSLDRLRVIPASDKQKEVFGIGISYDELSLPKGSFKLAAETGTRGERQYKINLIEDEKQADYFIDAKSYDLNEIHVFRNMHLQKKIKIKQIDSYFGERLITSWEVFDQINNRTITYIIQPDSISETPDNNLFYKNRLKRCAI